MEKTYNGRPLRAGFIQNFTHLPINDLLNIKNDLGLSMSAEKLIEFQKKTFRSDGKVTTDELYMADAFADSYAAFSVDYSFAEMRTSSAEIKEAFTDLMNKRRALGFALPINHASLADVYSKYLISAGYDQRSVRPTGNYDIKEKIPSGAVSSDRHIVGNCFGCEESNYTIAKTDAPYRFNTRKERIYPARRGGIYHLLLVKLENKPFAFEELANVLNSNAHLSKDIIYCAPIGKAGLFSALLDTSLGYVININTVSALIGEELRPYDLARPMSCALMLVPAEVSQSIALSVLDFGYGVRFVGHTTNIDANFSVLYEGINHTLRAKTIISLVHGYSSVVTLDDVPSETAFVKSIFPAENISLTVFSSLSFSETYEAIKKASEILMTSNPGKRVYAYLSMPTVNISTCSNHRETLGEFLGIYRALAENSIPLVRYDFIPHECRKNASVFLVCDE